MLVEIRALLVEGALSQGKPHKGAPNEAQEEGEAVVYPEPLP